MNRTSGAATNAASGPTGAAGVVQTVVAGVNITVNSGDAANPIVAMSLTDVTATNLANKAHAINTVGKTKGKFIYNTTNDLIYFALGTSDVSKWRLTGAVDATGDVTPA